MVLIQNQQSDPLNLTNGSDLDSSILWETTHAGAGPGFFIFYNSASPTTSDGYQGVYYKPPTTGPETGTNIARAFVTGASGGKLNETNLTVSVKMRPTALESLIGANGWPGGAASYDIDAGVILRASGITYASQNWYELGVTNLDTQTSGELLIRRVNAGTSTVLANPTFASLGSPTWKFPGETTTYTPGACGVKIVGTAKNLIDGSVELRVTVTQDTTVNPQSISVTVIDSSASRITAAGYGGIFATGDAPGANALWIHFQDWLLKAEYDEGGSPSNPPEASDDDPDLATEPALTPIAIADEGTSGGTLSPAPTLEIPIASEYVPVAAEMESGDVVTYPKFSTARRMWDLRWDPIKNSDEATLFAFYLARTGPIEPFMYSSPNYGNVKVIFEPGSYDAEVQSIATKRVSAKIIEVF